MTVDCTVRNGEFGLVARLAGRLGRSDVAPVRLHLLKCLAEQPPALFVDLAALSGAHVLALPLFTTIVRQAARWPGIPVLFCAPPPETATLLSAAAYRRMPIFDTLEAAHDHLGGGGQGVPSTAEELLPVSGAARQGRNVATDACLRWELPHLVAPASLICSELISNVCDHAGTLMHLRLSLSSTYLFIALRDGSPAEPVAITRSPAGRRGRGLQIVGATANSWGSLPAAGGKVVWASLRTDPPVPDADSQAFSSPASPETARIRET